MIRRLIFLVLLLVSFSSWAQSSVSGINPNDPWEPFNRSMFDFNDNLDRALIKPAAQAYRALVPEPVRNCVGNIFGNIGDLWSSANSLLQGKPMECARSLMRVGVNTVFGLGGCFDVAREMNGLERHDEDFGQTLGVWGLKPGAYLVLPLFGPSSVRDGLGLVLDKTASPTSEINDETTRNSMLGLQLLSVRADLLDATKALDEASFDRYVFIRDAYLQRRLNAVYDGDPPDDASSEAVELSQEPSTTPPEPVQSNNSAR